MNKGVLYTLLMLRWSFIALLATVGGAFFGFAFTLMAFDFGLGDVLPSLLDISWEAAFALSCGVLSVVMFLVIGFTANQQIWRPSLRRPRVARATKRTPDEVLFPAAFHDAARKNGPLRDEIRDAIVKCASTLSTGEYSEDEAIEIATKAVAGVMQMTWDVRKDTSKTIRHWSGILGDSGKAWKVAARVAAIK